MTALDRGLDELEWLTTRIANGPRNGHRVTRALGIQFSNDGGLTFHAAFSLDISVSGIAFIALTEIPAREMILTLDLGEQQRIQAGVACVTTQKGLLKGEVAWRVGSQFVRIAAKDRKLVERFVRGMPLNPRVHVEKKLVSDVAFLAILEQLVRLNRLAPLRGNDPLVKVTAAGTIRRGRKTLQSLTLESSVVTKWGTVVYTNKAYIDERMGLVEVVPLDDGKVPVRAA